MPLWGRPSGAKGIPRRKAWERDREHAYWEGSDVRVEELDTDDTDTGVGRAYGKRRFASDPLKFTGFDLADKPKSRQAYLYASDEESSSEEDSDESSAMQIWLREKEEALVQSALSRIRRAQEKGKREVKLNPEELEALEKRRKRLQAESQGKKDSRSGRDRKRRKEQMVTLQLPEPAPLASKPSKKKTRTRKSDPPSNVSAPGLLVALDDSTTHAPLGPYSPRYRSYTKRESHQQLHSPPRRVSDDARPTSSSSTSSRRPLPDEEAWAPQYSRRSSLSSQAALDPFEYQTSSPTPPSIPSAYASPFSIGRRHVSGPPEVAYSSLHRSPPSKNGYGIGRGDVQGVGGLTASHSDPAIPTVRRSKRPTGGKINYTEQESDSASGSRSGSGSGSGTEEMGGGVNVVIEEQGKNKAGRDGGRAPIPAVILRKPVSGKKRAKGR